MEFYCGIKILKVFIKRALRIISCRKFNVHTEPICREEQLLKVNEIYKLAIYKFYFKPINNELPHYFQDFTPTFSDGINHIYKETQIYKYPRLCMNFLSILSNTN